MTLDEFENKYKPINNHFSENKSETNYLFGTYGEEYAFVLEQEKNKIWTIVDGDNGIYIIPGLHFLNRINYIITENPWEGENIEVLYEGIEND
jgi:hypothetical protein